VRCLLSTAERTKANVSHRPSRGALLATVALALASGITPADAQSLFWWLDPPPQSRSRSRQRDEDRDQSERRQRPRRQIEPAVATRSVTSPIELPKTSPTLSQRANAPPLLAVISIGSQKLSLYDQTGRVLTSPISSGQSGHRTPTGVFSVIQKNRYHESNIYSGAPMPFMQRITWSGIAMHEGRLPGYPASHGCIRLPGAVAAKLFEMSKLGMRVVVSPSDTTAVPFEHDLLPVPVMTPAATPEAASAGGTSLIQTASIDTSPPGKANDAAATAAQLLSPHTRALAERTRARGAIAAAKKAVVTTLDTRQKSSALANQTDDELAVARKDVATAEARLAAVNASLQTAATPDAKTAAEAAMTDAETKLSGSTLRAIDLAKLAYERTDAAFDAVKAHRAAEEAAEAAETALRLAEKGVEPVSVFVSRKEARVFVRQGFEPIANWPVAIKDSHPLGTHLYVALTADGQTGKLGWNAVSVPAGSTDVEEPAPVKKVKAGQSQPVPTPVAATRRQPSDATEALARIEMAPEARKWITERIWLGGSLIISDVGLGTETGKGTDFVVLTK
jgi:lipoprotein-anchoring transpeptidase ErfK/SrfK